MPRPKITIDLTEADLELLTWRLCQPDYSGIGGRWERHETGATPEEAGWDLYQYLSGEWEKWWRESEGAALK